MKSIYSWFVLIVSIAFLVSSCGGDVEWVKSKKERRIQKGSGSTDTTTETTTSSTETTTSSSSNVFVAVGNSGTIVRSTDNGTTWDNVTSPTINHLYGVRFGYNTSVAVG